MYNNESNRGALDVINGAGNSSGLSGLRFQQLSSQQMQLTPRESSQRLFISRAEVFHKRVCSTRKAAVIEIA